MMLIKKPVLFFLFLFLSTPCFTEEQSLITFYPFLNTTMTVSRFQGSTGNETGYGFSTGLGVSGLLFSDGYLQGKVGYEFLNPLTPINLYYNRLYFSLLAGYNFTFAHSFTITPVAGWSVYNHITNNRIQTDHGPALAGLFDVHLMRNFHLTASLDFFMPVRSLGEIVFQATFGFRNHYSLILEQKKAPPPVLLSIPTPQLKPSPSPFPATELPPPPVPTPAPAIPELIRIEIAVTPELFSPDNDGEKDFLKIFIKLSGNSKIVKWRLTINDPMNTLFLSLSGNGTPPAQYTWNGLSNTGELVASAMEYPVIVEITDEYNRKSKGEAVIVTDILVLKSGNKLKVQIPNIHFAANASNLTIEDDPVKTAGNLKILYRLIEIFTKFKEYNIRIEGHANNLSWADPVQSKAEEETLLKPLSLERANAVRDALIKLGIEPERITTAGMGGTNPLVPFSDPVNMWKNRRVEIILIKL